MRDIKRVILGGGLLICLFAVGCGRRNRTEQPEISETVRTAEAAETLPAEMGPAETTTIKVWDEDPQARGYFLDAGLTAALAAWFSGENTNNTDEKDSYRCLTEDFKRRLDGIAKRWTLGEIEETAAAYELEEAAFSWPDDPYSQKHSLRHTHIRLYEMQADTAENLYEQLRLDNLSPRHYLFLQVYREYGSGQIRIYMINGMIW